MKVEFALRFMAGLAEADRIIAEAGDLAETRQPPYLLRLAYAIRGAAEGVAVGSVLREDHIEAINDALGYVSLRPRFQSHPISRIEYTPKGEPTRFHAPIADGRLVLAFTRPDAGEETARLHAILDLTEPLVELLEAAKNRDFKLRRCLADGRWFSPGGRSARPKFCSTRCRNRFNYRAKQEERFACSMCERVLPISRFSGVGNDDELFGDGAIASGLHLHGIADPEPLCIECASSFSAFKSYLSGALMEAREMEATA